jgi:hypothetical protein
MDQRNGKGGLNWKNDGENTTPRQRLHENERVSFEDDETSDIRKESQELFQGVLFFLMRGVDRQRSA